MVPRLRSSSIASRSAAPNLRDGLRENALWVTLTDVILDMEVDVDGDGGKDEGGVEDADPGGVVDDDEDDEVEELTSGIQRVPDDAV